MNEYELYELNVLILEKNLKHSFQNKERSFNAEKQKLQKQYLFEDRNLEFPSSQYCLVPNHMPHLLVCFFQFGT